MSTLLVAGTASHVGKSTVVAGLCRALSNRGIAVAPFKAQNMSNNARAVPTATRTPDDNDQNGTISPVGSGRGETADSAASSDSTCERPDADATGFGEIGVSQYVQARAARVQPTTDHNPVLLKPRGNAESQLVLDGEAVAHYSAGEYYETHWERARSTAVAAYQRLTAAASVVIAEGAGSIAEINLHDRDLANIETARFADASILLVADIERGGVFASIVGTLELVPEDIRERITGVLITKFRGDESLLEPGIDAVEDRTGVPVVGVVPYDDPGLPEEDSVALPGENERVVRGGDDVPTAQTITIAVPRLPRISNFTDFGPLAGDPGVEVSYRPIDDEYGDADAIVIPGTKNTVDDLLALRESGFDTELRAFEGPVVGLCGGYQLLGERITGATVEGTGGRSVVDGFGLLPVETEFSATKQVVERSHWCSGTELLPEGSMAGYEIHMGSTRATDSVEMPFSRDRQQDGTAALGAADGTVLGTYLHGLFEDTRVRRGFVDAVRSTAGVPAPDSKQRFKTPHDRAAELIEANIDVDWLSETLGIDLES